MVPTKYVVGDVDLVYHMPGAQDFIHSGEFKKYVPLLQEIVVIKGAGHFINEEKPDDINQHILDFLQQFWDFQVAFVKMLDISSLVL